MSEDLKIEIRELFALHEASVRLKHAVKEFESAEHNWRDFPPSSFIYAFFTFNSIYGINWEASFGEQKVIRWQPDEENHRYPKEEEQFKSYLKYVNTQLFPNASNLFADELKRMLNLFSITEPAIALEHVDLVSASKELENLNKKLTKQFSMVLQGDQKSNDFYPSICHLLKFVYEVRCNLFHGEKTRVQLLDSRQQQRLLIYTALLIAANGLLFRVAEKLIIGWEKVTVDFSQIRGN